MSIYSYRVAANLFDSSKLPGPVGEAIDDLSDSDANLMMNFAANEIGRAEGFAYTNGYGSGYDQSRMDTAGDVLRMLKGRQYDNDPEFLHHLEEYLLFLAKDTNAEV